MKLLAALLLIFTHSAFASGRIQLSFESSQVRQGALVKGVLKLDPSLVNVPVPKLKGQSFAETIYFHELSPLLRKENSDSFESDVQVIFIKIPESSSVAGKLGPYDVTFEWSATQIIPVEAPGQMLWAEFTAPGLFTRNWMWLWTIPLFTVLVIVAIRFWKKFDRRQKVKAKRRMLADEFRGCTHYNDIVTLWKKKHTYLSEFPQLEAPFRKFEEVLFRYQFKPVQTEAEKEMVVKAYRELLQDSEGGMRGI